MDTKKYSSYADIDRDLEILKLEKEINFQKFKLSIQQTSELITPQNIVNGFLEPYKEAIPSQLLSVFKAIIPYIISYFFNKKRGN
jgi:hypothetical protein